MPVATNSGVDLYYEIDGAADRAGGRTAGARATIVFVNPAGYGAWVWSWQHGALAGPFATLVWDLRGTGRSDAPEGPYEVSTLTEDLEAVLSDAGLGTVHLVGAGLGGMIAVEHARRYGRAESLTLFGTAATGDAVDRETVSALFAPRDDRVALRRSLAAAFAVDLETIPDIVSRIVDWRASGDADRAGFDAQVTAMVDYEAAALYEVTTPARVYHGEADVVVPPAAGRALAGDLPRGEFTLVDGGHLCFIESSGAVNDSLVGRLSDW